MPSYVERNYFVVKWMFYVVYPELLWFFLMENTGRVYL